MPVVMVVAQAPRVVHINHASPLTAAHVLLSKARILILKASMDTPCVHVLHNPVAKTLPAKTPRRPRPGVFRFIFRLVSVRGVFALVGASAFLSDSPFLIFFFFLITVIQHFISQTQRFVSAVSTVSHHRRAFANFATLNNRVIGASGGGAAQVVLDAEVLVSAVSAVSTVKHNCHAFGGPVRCLTNMQPRPSFQL